MNTALRISYYWRGNKGRPRSSDYPTYEQPASKITQTTGQTVLQVEGYIFQQKPVPIGKA